MDYLKVFSHQIYECKKGVRSMALCTLPTDSKDLVIKKLESSKLSYFICPLSKQRFNIFFGEQVCIDVVSKLCNKPLNELSPEEDFMLGAILGYSICEQCRRYCKKSSKETASAGYSKLANRQKILAEAS